MRVSLTLKGFAKTTAATVVSELNHFALALLIGAHQGSQWSNGNLVITAILGPIVLLHAAFYAVRLKVQRRGYSA